MKCLVIGDTHFDNKYPGYLQAQVKSCYDIINSVKPTHVVFLGDIFHHRKPNPEVIVETHKLFSKIALIPGLKKAYILRGNHDSANRSDDGLTVLETLDYPSSKATVVTQTLIDDDLKFVLIPHYEDEERIKEELSNAPDGYVVFGHFGFDGCINSTGFLDFHLNKEDFKNKTILGHIHNYAKHDHITILGTPWTTSFGECDKTSYVGVMETDENGFWGDLTLIQPENTVRHYVVTEDSLEPMKEDIEDSRYFTVLRVVVSNFSSQNYSDIKKDCKENYNAKHVDIKFEPVVDKKLKKRLSGYNPSQPVSNIDDKIVDKYIEEQSTTIPVENIRDGLQIIKRYEDSES